MLSMNKYCDNRNIQKYQISYNNRKCLVFSIIFCEKYKLRNSPQRRKRNELGMKCDAYN